MQNEAKSLLLPRLQTITNGRIEGSVSPMKPKPSLKDSLCYSESVYVSFNLNKRTPLYLWHSRTKMGKSKEMFTTDKKYTRSKRLACRIALEYCLKDSPCCTEWIAVRYKCIRYLIWMSM